MNNQVKKPWLQSAKAFLLPQISTILFQKRTYVLDFTFLRCIMKLRNNKFGKDVRFWRMKKHIFV